MVENTGKKREKLLNTINFSFSHSILEGLVLQIFKKKQSLFGKGLLQALVFTCLQYKSFENTFRKGEIARNEQFLRFPQCFLPVWKTFSRTFEIVVCKLFQFGRV